MAGVWQEALQGRSPSLREPDPPPPPPTREGRVMDLQDVVINGHGRWRSERYDAEARDPEKWPPVH